MAVGTGLRRYWVTIQQRPSADSAAAGTVDAGGTPQDAFVDLPPKILMAKKAAAGGVVFAEHQIADQVTSRVFTEWTMPYQANMDPDRLDVPKVRRLSHYGRIYDITSAHIEAAGAVREIRLVTLAKSSTS